MCNVIAGSMEYWLSLDIIQLFVQGKSKEAEVKRINKELANIRSKFKGNLLVD